jgi:circadian clock protein KaiB
VVSVDDDSGTAAPAPVKPHPIEINESHYELTLFVTGASALSAHAVADVRDMCENHLPRRYALSVVDVHQNPDLVTSRGILATPTLVKESPLPRRVLVGDLSDTDRVLSALDIASPSCATREAV